MTENKNFCLDIVDVIDPDEDQGAEENNAPMPSLGKKFLHYKSPKRDYDYVTVMRIRPKYKDINSYPPVIITKEQIQGVQWSPNKQEVSYVQPLVLFKDQNENFEIEAVITKRVKDKDFVLNNLLNGEDINNYMNKKKIKDLNMNNQYDDSEMQSEMEQLKTIKNQVKGM